LSSVLRRYPRRRHSDAPTSLSFVSSSRRLHIFTLPALPSHSRKRLLAPLDLTSERVSERYTALPTCSPDRWRRPPETRFSWQFCTVPAFVLLSRILQPLLAVVCIWPGPRHHHHHPLQSTRRSTSLHHHHHCDTGCACPLLDTRTPSWTTLVYWQFDSTTPHTRFVITATHCHPIERRTRRNSGQTNTKREQDNADRKLRFTGPLLPIDFTSTPTLVKHTHPHVSLDSIGFRTDFRDFHLHSPDLIHETTIRR
jgi:hypothetical protein